MWLAKWKEQIDNLQWACICEEDGHTLYVMFKKREGVFYWDLKPQGAAESF